ncbi:MAG: MarR family transcriptional regulator [Myxococcota bacterium]
MTASPLGPLLSRTHTLFHRAAEKALQAMDLGVAGYAALRALAVDGDASGAELARRCGVTPQAMHPVLVRMKKKAWVRTEPGKGRRHVVSITAAGLRAHDSAWARVQRAELALLANFEPAEVENLVLTLRRLQQAPSRDLERTVEDRNEEPLEPTSPS